VQPFPRLPDKTGPRTDSRPASSLVDVVSGSFGAGHDAAAEAIESRLHAAGCATRRWDIVDLMHRPLGRSLRAAYRSQVQWTPSAYGWLLRYANRGEGVHGVLARVMRHTEAHLLEAAGAGPAAIVSTHPFASHALGELRAQGRLPAPVVTYLTDMSVHKAWVHPAVDLHLALHQLPADQATGLGAGPTRVVRPAVPAAFWAVRSSPWSPTRCRRALGLPLRGPLVVVTGGSLGLGDLEQSAADISATGLARPVVLCGKNTRLWRRLRTSSSAIGLDWVDAMPLLLRAVDGVVQNSGGFSSLEALAAGVPVVTYRCIAGHGETNAAALHRAGLVPWIQTTADLAAGLHHALGPARSDPWPGTGEGPSDVAAAILGTPPA